MLKKIIPSGETLDLNELLLMKSSTNPDEKIITFDKHIVGEEVIHGHIMYMLFDKQEFNVPGISRAYSGTEKDLPTIFEFDVSIEFYKDAKKAVKALTTSQHEHTVFVTKAIEYTVRDELTEAQFSKLNGNYLDSVDPADKIKNILK